MRLHQVGLLACPFLLLVAVGCTNGTTGDETTSSSGTSGTASGTSQDASGSGSGSQSGSAGGSGSGGGGSSSSIGTSSSSGLVIRNPNPGGTDNNNRDSDCDGLTDEEEFGRLYAGDRKTDPHNPDSDGDGLLDGVEAGRTMVVEGDRSACGMFGGDLDTLTNTNPTLADSDGDGTPDGAEDRNLNGRGDAGEMDPLSTDSDGDGLSDGLEDANHNGTRQMDETSAAVRDTDDDGIPDGVEDVNLDGVRQPSETDPRVADTDSDGLEDGDEDVNWNHVVDTDETDPLQADTDTDMDGIPDTREMELGYSVNVADMDMDGLKDGEEDRNKNGIVEAGETNPRRLDSDCDGLKDGEEDLDHNGVVGPSETDPLARDSDGDLLADGLEKGVTTNPDPTNCSMVRVDVDPGSTTNPRVSDTDLDGINDGIEDVNRDGRRQNTETDPNNADTDADGIKDGNEDINRNNVVDVGETNPLLPDADTDMDGLPDPAETLLQTGVNNPDTDADGLKDGLEDRNHDGSISVDETDPRTKDTDCDGVADGEEDANKNGVKDMGELDPLNPDSDGDTILDGVEMGRTTNLDATRCTNFRAAALPSNMTSPLDPDSDHDGVPDGTEDANQNGRTDMGEFNPALAGDTTGVIQQACALSALTPIDFHSTPTPTPDIQLATTTSFGERVEVTVQGAPVGQILIDRTAAAPVAVFSFSRTPNLEGSANAVAVNSLTTLDTVGAGVDNPITQALPCLNFPTDCTWDGFPAVLGSYDLQATGDLVATTNTILDRLMPGSTGRLAGVANAPGPFKLKMQYVRRSDQRVVILGALMPASKFTPDTAAHLEDMANGSALAQVGDVTGVQCDVFTTSAYPKADILLVIDNSGSMGDDQDTLSLAAGTIVDQLSNALLDYRIGRITTDTDDPHNSSGTRIAVGYGDAAGTLAATNHHWPFLRPGDFGSDAAFKGVVQSKLAIPGTEGWGVEGTLQPLSFVLLDNPDTTKRLTPPTAIGAAADPFKLRGDAKLAVLMVTDAGEQSSVSQRPVHSDWSDGPNGSILKFLRGGPSNGVALPGTMNSETYDITRNGEAPIFLGGILCPLGVQCAGEEPSTGDSLLLKRYHDTVASMGGVTGSIEDTSSIVPTVQAFMTAVIGSASPYVLTKDPISASIKVSLEGQPSNPNCDFSNVPRSRVNGFDYDGATGQITFYGACRPSNDLAFLGKRMAVSYRYWVDRSPSPDGATAPCGGACVAPLVCNAISNQCECPANCGMAGGCAAPTQCDTSPAVCQCRCPADCGGSPSNPRLQCNTTSCEFECPADCGGPSPGPSFTCNRTTCRYECAACDVGTRPTSHPERWACDLATCSWSCPQDCATTNPGQGFRCNRQTCDYACTPDCGGSCTGNETCNTSTCTCSCRQNVTCAQGLKFDEASCSCVCDLAQLNCGDARVPDAASCSCLCKPNCGDTCTVGQLCNSSTCSCDTIGG